MPPLIATDQELQAAAFASLAKHRLSHAPIICHSLHPTTLHQPDGDPVPDNQLGGGEVLHGSGYAEQLTVPCEPWAFLLRVREPHAAGLAVPVSAALAGWIPTAWRWPVAIG